MPTISVNKQDFYRDIGRHFTYDEFYDLCFEYGLELDEDTEQTDPNTLPHQLKIEVAANRYDLLCHEGLVRAIKLYLGTIQPPNYRVAPWDDKSGYHIRVSPETEQVRPYCAGAVLRGIKFTKERYDSFIDLQDKLHMNLARKRKIVAIGTHDISRIASKDITYEARKPEDIKFVPLNQTKEMTAKEMMEFYTNDLHLRKYLDIIKDKPVYPVFYDSARTVLSMPPIINGDHTKITLDTTDVFIDLTATDEYKLSVVLNMMVTMFSEYTSEPFLVEPVKVEYPDGRTLITPDLKPRQMTVESKYINSFLGLSYKPDELCQLLKKMGLESKPSDNDNLKLQIPPTRSDILHPCDLVEEAAIAYGFNSLKKTFPTTNTVGKPLPINKLSDIVRAECAMAGWVEALPLMLASKAENFEFLNRKDDGKTAVVLENPKTVEFEIVRVSLLPGLLKTVRENKKHSLPLRLFEVSDIVVKDESKDRMAEGRRHVGAIYCGRKAGFEIVQGLMDRLMKILEVKLITSDSDAQGPAYYIKASGDATYFPDRGADIFYRPTSKGSESDIKFGSLGILHPEVLGHYDIDYPCSTLEFDLRLLL